MSKAKSFSEIIGGEESFNNFRTSVSGYEIVDKFEELFPKLKKVAKAKKFENGILFIRTENSVWRSELNFNKEAMIEKINDYLKKQVIKNIKFI